MRSDIELSVLKLCVRDKDFLSRASKGLNGYRFQNWARDWIWRKCYKCNAAHGGAPGFKLLATKALREFKTAGERGEIVTELRSIIHSDTPESPSATLEEMGQLMKIQRGAQIADSLITAVEKGSAEDVEEALRHSEAVVSNRSVRTGSVGLVDLADQISKPEPKDKDGSSLYIPTGFSYLDRRWRGFRIGEYVIYTGCTGVGKSISTIQTGGKSVCHMIRTLHITTEMDVESVGSRYLSWFTGIPEEDIRERKLTRSQQTVIERWKERNRDRLNKYLQIERFTPNKATVNEIRDALREQNDKGPKIGLLIVDSTDHVRSGKRHKDPRDDSTEVLWDMTGIASDFGVAIVSTTHIKREWEGRIAIPEAVADNIEKSRIASWFISINAIWPKGTNKADRAQGQAPIFLYIGKRRSGKGRGFLLPCVADYERMRLDTAPEDEEEDDAS